MIRDFSNSNNQKVKQSVDTVEGIHQSELLHLFPENVTCVSFIEDIEEPPVLHLLTTTNAHFGQSGEALH